MNLTTRTSAAFDEFRSLFEHPRLPAADRIEHENECLQMSASDGLLFWLDGAASNANDSQGSSPRITSEQIDERHLWVVRCDDVVHAQERSPFGLKVQKGVIKHTNLTGCRAAYSGGELIFLDEATVLLNGRSGRYGPRSEDEMTAVAKAFRKSGYYVWSCGYDEEAAQPFGFGNIDPVWIDIS